MILLEKYIKTFLKEAASTAIMKRASDLTGMSHHQSAASYSNDMSEIGNEEALLKVLENVGNNCFISFVDKYDEKIPRLEVSPKVSYDTPHGNYAYPLTVKSLKDIVEKGRIGGASFALERPYFHMFKKSNSLNSVEIQRDGNNNYNGDYNKDLRTIVHTAVMFNAAKILESNPRKYAAPSDSEEEENRVINFNFAKRRVIRRIKANSKSNELRNDVFYKTMKDLSEDLCYLVNLNDKKYPREIVELIVNFLTKALEFKINSTQNKFFVSRGEKSKLLSKFHGLYYACWMLSQIIVDDRDADDYDPLAFDVNKINNPQQNPLRQGTTFTMLLNSIDIDFINDKGSSTLHSSEPVQAAYLNSSKKENVVLVGTFNNIFQNKHMKKIKDIYKPITMNKIVDILSQNPQLNSIFGTELFDDVKLEHPLSDLRKKAWKDLTESNKTKFFDYILFHSSNKIFNFNIYFKMDSRLIVFDIGIKDKFLNYSIKRKIKAMKNFYKNNNISKFENSLTYIQVFLSKHRNKSIYTIKDEDNYDNIMKVLDQIQDYAANLEWSSLTDDEEKNEFIMIKVFLQICQEVSHLAGIASYQ